MAPKVKIAPQRGQMAPRVESIVVDTGLNIQAPQEGSAEGNPTVYVDMSEIERRRGWVGPHQKGDGRTIIQNDAAYLEHKVGRQVVGPPVRMVGVALEVAGHYYVNAAAIGNPDLDPKIREGFRGSASLIYRDDNRTGRTFKRLLPLPYRDAAQPMDAGTVKALERSGARFLRYGNYSTQGMNVIRALENGRAIEKCMESGCGGVEKTVIATDSGSLVLSVPSTYIRGKGIANMVRGDDLRALSQLEWATKVGVGVGVFRAVAGGTRMVIEADRYMVTGDGNGSAIFFGAVDAMTGTSQMVASADLLTRTRSVRVANTTQKTLVLAAKIGKWGSVAGITLKVANSAAAGVGVVSNGFIAIRAVASDGPMDGQELKNFQSGMIGIAGSGLLIASALIVAPALIPLSNVLWIAGMIILVYQSIYDHYDEDGGLIDLRPRRAVVEMEEGEVPPLPSSDHLMFAGGVLIQSPYE